ncbi:hypothetical protein Tco_1493627 [Tanacetum coccineum]
MFGSWNSSASATINVADLQPYYDPDEPLPSLRSNFSEDREDDRKALVQAHNATYTDPTQRWISLHLKYSRSSKVNRSKKLYSSNQETKSYAQSRYEEFNEETGEFPDLIDQFRAKHIKRGKWNSLVAEERYNKMIELREAQEGRDTPMTVDGILSEVLGKSKGFFTRMRSFSVSQDQISQIHQLFINNNMQVPVPTLLNPAQFMNVVQDAPEDDVAPGDDIGLRDEYGGM